MTVLLQNYKECITITYTNNSKMKIFIQRSRIIYKNFHFLFSFFIFHFNLTITIKMKYKKHLYIIYIYIWNFFYYLLHVL